MGYTSHFKLLNDSYEMKLIILVLVSVLASLDFCASFNLGALVGGLVNTQRHAPKTGFNAVFESKNYPGQGWGVVGDRGVLTPHMQQFKVVPGICGEIATISFQSVANPALYLRHAGFVIRLHERGLGATFDRDACFYPKYDGYFMGYATYESVNYPYRFIRHKGSKLVVEPYEGLYPSEVYRKDVSWKTVEK